MAVRSTMANILLRVRLLINDQGGSLVFTDAQLQDTLDQRRADVRYYELASMPTLASGGAVTWQEFYAPDYADGWWEEDEQILSNTYAVLTPTTSDRIVGHWSFNATQLPPLYIVGKVFDLYAAAADTLEQWIALLKLEYGSTQEKDVFNRRERIENMQDLIAAYRGKQRPGGGDLVRADTITGYSLNWNERPWSIGR